jgi:hypothetical protein
MTDTDVPEIVSRQSQGFFKQKEPELATARCCVETWHAWTLFLRSVSHLTFALESRGYEGASQQTEGVVEKRDIVGKWSPDDWREFDRWIRANAVIGSLLAAGLLVMAVAGAPSARPGDAAAAADSKGSGVGASVQSRLAPAP